MGEKKEVIFVLAVLLVIFVSAAVFSQEVNLAPNQPTDVNVTVSGALLPQVVFISSIVNPSPIENGFTTVSFNVHIYDGDGANNINDSSVLANFSRGGEDLRGDVSCSFVNDLVDGFTSNYSCTITMWYFDGAGEWNVSVSGSDVEGNVAVNNTETFNYQLLKAIVVTPNLITFPTVSSGSLNQVSNNDPTIVNNTGNDVASININAIDLYGEADSSFIIPAANFSVHATSGSECTGTALVNGTSTSILSTNLDNGNLSLGGGVAQETVYYCITQVPLNLLSQSYSSSQGGSWILSI